MSVYYCMENKIGWVGQFFVPPPFLMEGGAYSITLVGMYLLHTDVPYCTGFGAISFEYIGVLDSGLENSFWTYSSCGASGLNFSLVLTPVELVLKSGILKETKHIVQCYYIV